MMTMAELMAAPSSVADLPPLTDQQCASVAALLSSVRPGKTT